jgi:tripartite-type tricarboxylate transporter receptor subunit TctC
MTTAIAGEYPERPIRIIVPFPAGDAADILVRLVGQKLTAHLGQQVIVDNRAGAAGQLGLDHAARLRSFEIAVEVRG